MRDSRGTAERGKSKLADSPVIAWLVAAAAFVAAAFCMVSLTWDGSYFMVRTLQEGMPTIAAHRWFHWVLLEPVLWMRGVVHDPAGLSVVHGLTCSLPPLLSLAACMAMLRGEYARLRIWALAGILLAPLPGQFFLITEVTPAIQLAWILFAFAWRGCPARWAPAVVAASGAMATLHPAAAPLFLFAAISAAALGLAGDRAERPRMFAWSGVFAAAMIVKLCETMVHATPYEHESMSPAVWLAESRTGLRYSPFPALLPVFVDMSLFAWTLVRPGSRARKPWLSRALWAASFILGIDYAIDTGGWTASINYRKFALVVTAPFVLAAGFDAFRLRRTAHGGGSLPAAGISLICPALLFAMVLSLMSFSWLALCRTFTGQLAAHPGRVMAYDDLPKPECYSALNHWSTTSLSLVLQGWEPRKVFIRDSRLQLSGGFHICPGDDFRCEDKAFKLAWLAGISNNDAAPAPPRSATPGH